MNKPSILIVGAGGLGVLTAYHLKPSGAGISFFVRPNRVDALSRPQQLYSYNTQCINTLQDYQVFADMPSLQGKRFDFVLLTLDGAGCRTAEGVSLIEKIGKLLKHSGGKLVICGVGFGLYDHVKAHTGLADNDVLEGTMVSFCYQVDRTGTPKPEESEMHKHDQCDFAYFDFSNKRGFLIAGASAPVKQFARLFNQNGTVNCFRMPRKLFRSSTAGYVAFTAACELANWESLDAVINNRELWRLACQSQREIFRLQQHGLSGKLMALLMSDTRHASMMRALERDAAPMGLIDFFLFHHGGKVQQQNIRGLKNCVQAGEQQGRTMPASRELLSRCQHLLDSHNRKWKTGKAINSRGDRL
jgi:hypothetical protein